MMMAEGMSTNGYTVVPIILDPHLDLAEKKNLQTLIDDYRNIHNKIVTEGSNGFFQSKVQSIDDLDGSTKQPHQDAGTSRKFGEFINYTAFEDNDINSNLIRTLFSTENLNNSLSVGFKGSPNVGTVALGNMVEGSDWFTAFKQHCEEGDRVFIISSFFGGTGASGFPIIEKKIKLAADLPAVQRALMGAVTVLPYYKLKDPKTNNSSIDSTNFYTKAKAALTYYDGKVLSDYLYYIGERSLRGNYENNEQVQDDKANFIELVAASALFHFLRQEKPEKQQFLTRSIAEDKDTLTLSEMGKGYSEIVKTTADFMILNHLISLLPNEKQFPLIKNCGFDTGFYQSNDFQSLKSFARRFEEWYHELSSNDRHFCPLRFPEDAGRNMTGYVSGYSLRAKNESYYLLRMIQAANKDKTKDKNYKLRALLQYAHEAINGYTKDILQ